MDPATNSQVLRAAVDIIKQRDIALLGHFARVRGRGLVGDDQPVDEEGVADERAGEDAAGFEVLARVFRGEGEE